jgi:hypothetical protein
LEIAGQDGTQAFNDLLIAAAKLEDQIGDTRARVKILASDTFKFDAAVGATQALASGFELAQGAATLFGAENEDLQKAIAKVTAATAVANSVQQLSALIKEESAAKTAALNILERINAASVRQSAVSYNIFGASVQFSARSLNIFKGALAATGIGAAVIAIGVLIDIYKDLQDATAKSAQGLKEITNANQDLAVKTIEAQEQLDLALGKISERQVERNIATRKFASELLDIQIANNKRLQDNQEATDKAILLSRAANIAGILAPAIQAKLAQDVKKLEQERVGITEEANKQIETARKNFNLERQKAEVEAVQKEKAATKTSVVSKDENIKKVKELTLEYIKMSESLDEYTKKQYDSIKFNAELTELDTRSQSDQLNSRVLFLQAEEAAGDKSLENRIAIIKAEGEAKKAALEQDVDRANKIKIIDAETQKAITDTKKDETEKQIALIQAYAAAVASVFSSINELSKLQTEKRIEDIQAVSDKELEAINASTELENDKERQRAALAKRTNAAIAAEKTKQAKADKALAIFQATISVAQQVAQNLANPALAIIIAAAGAIQIAAIAARPIPKFERGGVVGGRRHTDGGTMVEAERDEYIVNRRQSMRHRSELDAINSSSDAFRKLIEQRYVRPALMDYVAGNRNKQGVTVNASLNSKSMEKELRGMRKDLSKRNMTININQQDSRYLWQ